jgi:membrane-associated phospholipid phosphatase
LPGGRRRGSDTLKGPPKVRTHTGGNRRSAESDATPWWIVGFCGLVVLLAAAASVASGGGIVAWDSPAGAFLKVSATSPALGLLKFVNLVGDFTVMAAGGTVVAIFLWFRGARTRGAAVFLLFALGAVVIEVLKVLFDRARPPAMLVAESGASFPSGHAAAAAILCCLVLWSSPGRRGAWAFAAASLLWLLLVDYDRLALGVHYISDVIGGDGLGFFVGGLGTATFSAQRSRVAALLGEARATRRPDASVEGNMGLVPEPPAR